MSEETRAGAAAVSTQVAAVTKPTLPAPRVEVPDLQSADAKTRGDIEQRMNEIDLADAGTIIRFGSGAQTGLQDISQTMLADVRNKDLGPAGDSLRDLVTAIRGFSVDELDLGRKPGFFDRLLGRAAPMAKFVAQYEEVQSQIDRITSDLLRHEHGLMKDIESLDLLYEQTLAFYNELALYIAAGVERLARADGDEIPAAQKTADAAKDEEKVMAAQALRDIRAARDDLERRVHDLRLTRQVTMQALPSIRLVQENDKSLITKINSTLVNTVPLWETQLAQAVTIHRSASAAQAVKSAADLTNDLLRKNAETLGEANRTVREQVERGVFDIEAVKAANDALIATIDDSLRIAEEGKTKRAAAEVELQRLEGELATALASAKARANPRTEA